LGRSCSLNYNAIAVAGWDSVPAPHLPATRLDRRLQIDTVIPVAGKGVIVGTADGGATLRDVATDVEDLRRRFRYL
jgi:hypothetical protein